MKHLKIVFAGTGHFSSAYLKSLLASPHHVVLSITQPDAQSGRGQKIIFSPVKILSIKNNIPVLQPFHWCDNNIQKKILKYNADIMIVVSYGKIIPEKILNMFPKKSINIHPSLLPRWRGSTPIQSSILYNDKKTGISIIYMNKNIDSGNIIYSVSCDISQQDTTKTLSLKLIEIGTTALIKVLKKITKNKITETIQNEKHAVFSKKIFKQDALLNWKLHAKKLERLIRAFDPWPICYFIIEQKMIKVWQASVIKKNQINAHIGEIIDVNPNGIQINTAKNILNIEKIQFPGKKITHVKYIWNNKKNFFKIGTII